MSGNDWNIILPGIHEQIIFLDEENRFVKSREFAAAIGSEMNELYQLMCYKPTVKCYLPESFEWLILKSGMIEGKNIQDILDTPEIHISNTVKVS